MKKYDKFINEKVKTNVEKCYDLIMASNDIYALFDEEVVSGSWASEYEEEGYDDEYEYSESFDLVFTNIASVVEDLHNLRGVICPPDESAIYPLEVVEIFVQNTGTYAESTSVSLSYN